MPHFDITAAEAEMRKQVAATKVDGARLAAEQPEAAAFISAQRYFDEARLQFALAMMKASNHGVDRNILLSAAAVGVANIYIGLQESCVGPRERNIVEQWLQQTVAQVVQGQAQASHISKFSAEEGGNA